MLLKLGFLFFVCFIVSEAKVTWTFYDHYGLDRGMLNATIGTPGQNIELKIIRNPHITTTLNIISTTEKYNQFNLYNPTLSSTYKNLTDFNINNGSVDATETFVVGDGTGLTLKNLPFIDTSYYYHEMTYSPLSLFRSTANGVSFIHEVIKTMEEPIAVLKYDQVAYFSPDRLAGTLTLGGNSDDCSTDWTRVKEMGYTDRFGRNWQWDFKLDRIEVGKFAVAEPGQGLIEFTEANIAFPFTVYWNIATALGANKQGGIPCNATKTIKYTIGGLEFELGPELYVKPDRFKSDCSFGAVESDDIRSYVLPVGALRDHCFLMDYEKKEVGFAKKLN